MADIYNHEMKMKLLVEKISRSSIPAKNKHLILEFDKYLVAEGLSLTRRIKLCEHIYQVALRFLKIPFKRASSKAIWEAVYLIESSNFSPWTKHDYKVAIRKFFKFVEWGFKGLNTKDMPKSVAKISTSIRKKDKVRIQASDILTTEEVEQLVEAATDTQERAFITLIYELGARIGEIGCMNIGSVSRDKYSFICDVNGKTGPRSPRVVLSAATLTNWLNAHPERNSPGTPLWGRYKNGKWTRANYRFLSGVVQNLALKAAIKKRVHTHLFRHTRITHILASGKMNEAQVKMYFGLQPDSNVLATYSHLISRDSNNAVLRMYGITPEGKDPGIVPRNCGMCGEINEKGSQFCRRCGYALSLDAPKKAAERVDQAGQQIAKFLNKPEIALAFRQMVREEIENVLSDALPQKSVPPREPTQARRAA